MKYCNYKNLMSIQYPFALLHYLFQWVSLYLVLFSIKNFSLLQNKYFTALLKEHR